MNNKYILIYGELTQNKVRPVVIELVSKAQELKQKLTDTKIGVIIIGDDIDYSNIIEEIKLYGADDIIIIKKSKLKDYNNCYYPEIFYQVSQQYNPEIILLGATQQGKEIASYVSTKYETGLTADCTELDINPEGKLLSTRPTFGGQLTADILCKTQPQMATVQEHTFSLKQFEANTNVIYENYDLENTNNNISVIKTINKVRNCKDVTTAQIVVSGGLGACNDNGFELIKQFAEKINAAVAGSREAYERGYITKSQQIGQTGKTVAPLLYIAIGISGANQHLTGIKNSGKIIAINKDKDAPIFQHADIGIIGDLFEVLPELIRSFESEE